MGDTPRKWWVYVVRGIAAIAFGIAAWAWPNLTIGTLVILFGIFAIIDGILSIWAALLTSAEGHRISLIVADVCLEDGSGRELVRRLRALKPNLKAILTTGYDPHQMRGKIDLQPDELFLAKPFQTEELLHAIESLLQPRQA